jgi:hypothetical protein
MALADNHIEDRDIGPLWTEHFSKNRKNTESKRIVLALVYTIERKAKTGATTGDWSDRVFQELRRYGIPPDEFWEIQSTTQR